MLSRWAGVFIGAALFAANAGAAHAATWTAETTPEPPNLDSYVLLADVACPTPRLCAAVGYYGDTIEGRARPLLEHRDRDGSWSLETLPFPIDLGDGFLRGVSCSSPSACVAVGVSVAKETPYTKRLLAARWDGADWSLEAMPAPALSTETELNSVSCSSDTQCVAVGNFVRADNAAPPGVFAAHWNGVRWTVREITPPSTTAYLEDVSCVSATACTAVGSFYDEIRYTVLVEHWDGIGWRQQATETRSLQTTESPPDYYYLTSYFDAVSCPTATICTAVGHTGSDDDSDFLAERWNGLSWSAQSTPPSSTFEGMYDRFREVSCPSTSMCMAVDGLGGMRRWEDGGGWAGGEPLPGPPGSGGASAVSVSCANPHTCVAGGAWIGDDHRQHPFVARYE